MKNGESRKNVTSLLKTFGNPAQICAKGIFYCKGREKMDTKKPFKDDSSHVLRSFLRIFALKYEKNIVDILSDCYALQFQFIFEPISLLL